MRSWWAGLLVSNLPFVRLVGLNGSLVTGAWTTASDIDWYIVVKPGSIYTMRAVLALLLHCMGVRRHGNKVAARICLNRFATSNLLKIGPENEYHARVFSGTVFLSGWNSEYEKFIQFNQWMYQYGYPVTATLVLPKRNQARIAQLLLELMLTPLIVVSEPLVRRWQLKRAQHNPAVANPQSRVRLSDDELCFHLAK